MEVELCRRFCILKMRNVLCVYIDRTCVIVNRPRDCVEFFSKGEMPRVYLERIILVKKLHCNRQMIKNIININLFFFPGNLTCCCSADSLFSYRNLYLTETELFERISYDTYFTDSTQNKSR